MCTPLPHTTMQCTADVSHTRWANMGVQIGYGKYLGFLVGPRATAEANFAAAMRKFRLRAEQWLSLTHLGAFFQVLGFNMFAISVFNCVSQLYILPTECLKECRETSLKFMHGPRYWLHGVGGHVFLGLERKSGFQQCLNVWNHWGTHGSFSVFLGLWVGPIRRTAAPSSLEEDLVLRIT